MSIEEQNTLIYKYYKEGVSLAGITSLLYVHGLEGIQYQDLRKDIQKEIQRINSREKK